jgi:serine/threonine protein kinase
LRNLKETESEIKIGDFGFAKTMVDMSKFTNTILGTQFYTAPEIRRNIPYNYKLDIWGIGIILLDLLLPEVLIFDLKISIDVRFCL